LNNNQWVMQEIKEKNIIDKVKMIKWITFVEEISKIFFYRKNIIKSVKLSNLHDIVLTNAKNMNLQDENCFFYYKLNYIFEECFNQIAKIIAVNNDEKNEYNCFILKSNSCWNHV
jgi:hypothetical protein